MAFLRRKLLCAIAGAVVATAATSAVMAQTANSSGEVRRADAATGKIAIKHGAISALDLPAMTLVYQAAPNLLEGVKAGDKVSFTAKRENDSYVVTELKK